MSQIPAALPIEYGSPAWRAEFDGTFQVKILEDNWFFGWLRRRGWSMAGVTIWDRIYLKRIYIGTDRGAQLLRHEKAHVRDQKRWHVLMWLSYYLLLPTVFTMRAFWEWRGYREDLRSVWQEYHDQPQVLDSYASWVTSQFTGISYFYMFPFRSIVYSWCQNFYKSLRM